jgi:secondary thiamine-phosphate synthase enzyme
MVTLTVRSSKREEMLDVTGQVQKALDQSGILDGMCMVYVPHTTAALIINEGADPMVCRDIVDNLSRLVPRDGGYRHSEGNADAHIKVAALGTSQTVLVEGGRIRLGQWQRIFFCEFDGPRTRSLWVKVMGI